MGADIVMESLTLIIPEKGEEKAQSCVNAWLRQLTATGTQVS
jgi:hypothetical protein